MSLRPGAEPAPDPREADEPVPAVFDQDLVPGDR